MRYRTIFASFSLAVGLATNARATVFTLSFSGNISFSNNAGTGGTFTGYMRYDPSTMTISKSSYSATIDKVYYVPIIDMYAESGTVSEYASSAADHGGNQTQGSLGNNFYVADSRSSSSDTYQIYEGDMELVFAGNSNTMNTTDLPTTAAMFSAFPVELLNFNGGGTVFNGTITSMSLSSVPSSADAGAVPEPTIWAMMIGGFGMIGAAMRRNRRASLNLRSL